MKIGGHRGYGIQYLENGIRAIKKSIESKLDMIEIDVDYTKDKIIVLSHNHKGRTYKNSVTNYQAVRYTYSELKRINKELITLDEAVEVIQDKIPIIIDLKGRSKRLFYEIEEKTAGITKCYYVHFWWDNIIKEIYLSNNKVIGIGFENKKEIPVQLQRRNLAGLCINYKLISTNLIGKIRIARPDMIIHSNWSVKKRDSRCGLEYLMGLNIDVITTDYPDLAQKYLRGDIK